MHYYYFIHQSGGITEESDVVMAQETRLDWLMAQLKSIDETIAMKKKKEMKHFETDRREQYRIYSISLMNEGNDA